MLDDRDGRRIEVERGTEGGIRVDIVVVRHLFATELDGLGNTVTAGALVERGGLVRILSIPQCRRAGTADLEGVPAGEPVRDGTIVGSRVLEGLPRKATALLERRASELQRLVDDRVTRGRRHNRDIRVVLGGRAHHGRPADVDLLDDRVIRCTRGDRLDERVEVRNDEFERLDPLLCELVLVGLQAQVGEQPRVDGRVERAHPPVERFGITGHVGDLSDRDPRRRNGGCGRTGGDDLHARGRQRGRKLEQLALVADGDQGTPDPDDVARTIERGVDGWAAHESSLG